MAQWGGARPGAGRKKANPNSRPRQDAEVRVRPAETKLTPMIPAEPKQEPREIDWATMLPAIEEISKRYALTQARSQSSTPFRFPEFPKEAMPPQAQTMAMDNALTTNLGFASKEWLAAGEIGGLSGEGLLFLGYTYLSELAQRPEYRVMSETIADDATRKWIDFDVVGDEKSQREQRDKDPAGFDERMADPDQRKKRVAAGGKSDKVKALQDDQTRLDMKKRFYEQCRNGGFFGRSHLYCDIWSNGTSENSPEESAMPIGDGRGDLSKAKIPKGSFRALRTIEPVWTYPLAYNAINPLREDWYNPQTWYVMGQQIHGSRLRTFIPHPVPDMLKPAYAFGGLSLSQMAKPYVDIWLQTRQSVAELIKSFSVMVLMTDLQTLMQPGSLGNLLARVAMFNMFRDNQGTFVVNKNTEDFKNVSASLAGLHELQSQAQEHMSSVNRIPLVKLTGIQPAGLNASSEGEIEVYDDTIGAYQSRVLDSDLSTVICFQMLSLFGELDPEITHRWEPLRPMTQAEKGQKEKDDADRNQKYVDMGALSPEEVRKIIIEDKELPYTGLDPDDVPEPPAEEGLLGPGAGGAAKVEAEAAAGESDEGGGASDAHIPFAQDDGGAWSEADHPRAPDGRFGSVSGAGGAAEATSPYEGSRGKFKGRSESLKDKGFKPIKRGNSASLTSSAQMAWHHAIEENKQQVLVPAPGRGGWNFQKPGDTIPPGGAHATVEPDGMVTLWQPDFSASTSGPDEPEKKSGRKYGGLYRQTGQGQRADHEATVEYALKSGPRSGSSYRELLGRLIKDTPVFGREGDADKLKGILAQSYLQAADQLRARASIASGAEVEKLQAMANKATVRAAALGADRPPEPAGDWTADHGASPELKAFREETRKDLVDRGIASNLEDLSLFDLKTGKELKMPAAKRESKFVGFSKAMIREFENSANSLELHHNHPSDTSFSAADIECLAWYPGMSRVYAHGHGGSTYSLDGATKLPIGGMKEVMNAAAGGKVDGTKSVYDAIGDMPFSPSDKNRIYQHVVMLGLERAGAVSGYRAHLAPDLADRIEGVKNYFEKWTDAAAEGAKRGMGRR